MDAPSVVPNATTRPAARGVTALAVVAMVVALALAALAHSLAVTLERQAHVRTSLEITAALAILLAGTLAWWALALQRRDAGRLAESEAQWRSLADADPDALLVHVDGRILFANAAAAQSLGTPSPDHLVGRVILDYLPSDDERAAARERLRSIKESGRPSQPTIVTVRAEDGTLRQLEARGAPMRFRGAEAIVLSLRDVSTRLAAERGQRETESRYRFLAENSVDLVMIRGLDGRFLYVSPSFEQILGWRPEELMGRPSDSLLHPDDVPQVIALDRALRDGAPSASAITRLRHRDGHWINCEGVATLNRAADGTIEGISVTARDITERLLLEEQVHQGQKQEALGRMAGGVAHDFNTLLTVVRASAGLLRSEELAPHTRGELLDEIDAAVERAVGLTAQMLNIAKSQHVTRVLIPLGELVHRTFPAVRRLVGRAIETETSVSSAAEQAVVRGDAARLDQVLLALLLNAKEAMPTGGTLQVRADAVHLTEPLPHLHGVVAPGHYAIICVRDSGLGMTPEVLARAFDPFFTTKPQGKGSGLGLGLSSSLGIVQQAGGAITVESAPGAGTTVTVYWPIAEATSSAERPVAMSTPHESSAAISPLPGAHPTLVLVDDEPMLVRIATRVLERAGYHVLSAASGDEALTIVRREHDGIAALLADVRMPGMGGVELVAALIAEGIDLPVLFMSGHLDAPLPSTWPSSVPRRFLGKPYEHHELLAAVEQLLGAVRDVA